MNPPTQTQAHVQNPLSLAVVGMAVAWLVAACSPERDHAVERDGAVEPSAAGQAAVSPAEVAEGEVPAAPEAAVDAECAVERDGAVEPAAAGQAAVSPAEVAEGEVPEAPEAAVDAEAGGLSFLPVTGSARRFALTGVPDPRGLAAIHAVPGLTVLEKPGGNGPVDVSWHDPRAAEPGALAALTAAGVPVAGELLEFELRRPADMETNCPSCLFSSYQAAREAPGVKDVRTFLGDPENRVIELVVDPDSVTPAHLAEIMRPTHHHTP